MQANKLIRELTEKNVQREEQLGFEEYKDQVVPNVLIRLTGNEKGGMTFYELRKHMETRTDIYKLLKNDVAQVTGLLKSAEDQSAIHRARAGTAEA